MPPFSTKSEVSYAKKLLAYPIYAADFDPYGRGYLIIGGGGGEGRSGVPNQISVLDVSDRASIATVAEIELSREEDSVYSLASLATKDGLIALAGINSSQASQNAGTNEHLRTFDVRYPPRKKQKVDGEKEALGEITLLGKRSLFKTSPGPKKETYQRLLRLSPVKKREGGIKRIGVIASGLAKDNEVIVFDATVSSPDPADIITKITLPTGSEAADLDVTRTAESDFTITYCDDYGIYEQTIEYDFAKKRAALRPSGPRRIFQIPIADSSQGSKSRPKFRCLRFLDSENIIVLLNKPNRTGAELRVYHLYPTGPAAQVQQIDLPRRIKQAASLDVCTLDADKNGDFQAVIAVAGQDISIEILTANYQSSAGMFSKLRSYNSFRNVHDQQMTKLCFSPFLSPQRETDQSSGDSEKEAPAPSHPGPQYIKLASVSYGNTVVVDTFPLSPFKPVDKRSRYVLSHPTDQQFWRWAYILVFSVVVLVTGILIQSFYAGNLETDGRPFGIIPESLQNYLGRPAVVAEHHAGLTRVITSTVLRIVPDTTPNVATIETMSPDLATIEIATPALNLRDAISEHLSPDETDSQTKVVVVRHGPGDEGVVVDVHPDKQAYVAENLDAKHWDELEEHQRDALKEKLIEAGHWAEHEGEVVLKGVLWSTYAGFVGQAAGQILQGL